MELVLAVIHAVAIVAPIAGLLWLMNEEFENRKPTWAVHVGFVALALYLVTMLLWRI